MDERDDEEEDETDIEVLTKKNEKERIRRATIRSHFETMKTIVRKFKRMTMPSSNSNNRMNRFLADQKRASKTEIMEDCILLLQKLIEDNQKLQKLIGDNQKLYRDNIMMKSQIHLEEEKSSSLDSDRFVSV